LKIDEDLFLEKIQTVPRKTRAQFNNIVEMIRVLAMQLSELGMQSYIQQEELAYRKEIETELRSEKIKLELSHQHDELTGLLSKARFDEKLKKLVQDKAYPIVFFAGDMNNLKLCNDVFGHRIGDAALKVVADILRKEAGVDYIIGRRSGDEFCIAIPYGRALEAEDYCSRIHKACAEVSNTMLPPSLSLGYAILKSEEDDLRSVMNQAEEAMYNAKVQRKRKQNIHNDIMELLYQKQYISKKQVAESVHRIERFSRYLNLEEYTVQMLRLSAKIQDVGLIAIPKHIVEKDAELTEKEYVEMSKHTLIGYRLARLYEESFPASNTILQSHECWSGMGYPNRLKGKEILYTARVLFMVTSYSYWIYPKPTGSGMDVAEARERLRQEAGKQFDPKLVDSFLEYLENEEPME